MTHAIFQFESWYHAVPWSGRALVFVSLVLVTMAFVFLAIQVFAYLMLRSLRREIREPREPWTLTPVPKRECETYCRVCRAYKVTTETACEVCGTPLRLFSDAIDMSAHMARTFPLPPVTKDAAIYVPQRHRRVQ